MSGPEVKITSGDIVSKRLAGEAYTIQAGDTLAKIARKYRADGMKLKEAVDLIAKYNGIKDIDEIQAGRVLRLPLHEGKLDSSKKEITNRTQKELKQLERFLTGEIQIRVEELMGGARDAGKISKFLNSKSIVDTLNLLGVNSSLDFRKNLYQEMIGADLPEKSEGGLDSAKMNMELLKRIKAMVEEASVVGGSIDDTAEAEALRVQEEKEPLKTEYKWRDHLKPSLTNEVKRGFEDRLKQNLGNGLVENLTDAIFEVKENNVEVFLYWKNDSLMLDTYGRGIQRFEGKTVDEVLGKIKNRFSKKVEAKETPTEPITHKNKEITFEAFQQVGGTEDEFENIRNLLKSKKAMERAQGRDAFQNIWNRINIKSGGTIRIKGAGGVGREITNENFEGADEGSTKKYIDKLFKKNAEVRTLDSEEQTMLKEALWKQLGAEINKCITINFRKRQNITGWTKIEISFTTVGESIQSMAGSGKNFQKALDSLKPVEEQED